MTASATQTARSSTLSCAHCGDPCGRRAVEFENHSFCCNGCKTVYSLLQDRGLSAYYDLNGKTGVRPKSESADRFAYLDDLDLARQLVQYRDESRTRVTVRLPAIHCSSCVWLLEHLTALNQDIIHTRVHFPRRELDVLFDHSRLSLRGLAELLTSLGYEPVFKTTDSKAGETDFSLRRLYARIATAGFCFGNVMLLRFPEYLGLGTGLSDSFSHLFSVLGLLLSIPVVFYSGAEFLEAAWRGLRHRQINMDVPIALGIIVLFLRSGWEVLLTGQGAYLDSLCALVFFLLLGRLYQRKTYSAIRFDTSYLDFFPIAVIVRQDGREHSKRLHELGAGDRVIIRNAELIPADAVLISAEAYLDYSFVTGESRLDHVESGAQLFAGGRHLGPAIEIELLRSASASRFVRVWSDATASHSNGSLVALADRISRFFTPAVLGLAASAAVFWLLTDPSRALDSAIAVLIVACPCALALAAPFTLGTINRLMGRAGLYPKNTITLEHMARVSSIVFDKTGTITSSRPTLASWHGRPLSPMQLIQIGSLVRNSTHPMSRMVSDWIDADIPVDSEIEAFEEETGFGVAGRICGQTVRIGSAAWADVTPPDSAGDSDRESHVYVSIDNEPVGCFTVERTLRPGISELMDSLRAKHQLSLLSGDRENHRPAMQELMGREAEIRLNQLPSDKISFVENQQRAGEAVLMLGDGLNDAGALATADIGIAVTDTTTACTPSCDAVLHADSLCKLSGFIKLARRAVGIIKFCFAISFVYNAVGLAFAISGNLSPVVAAVLMPASSVSVVLCATLLSVLAARRSGINRKSK